MSKPSGAELRHASGFPVRAAALVLAAQFLFVFGLYLHTLSSAFHPDDSPETIACAVVLGIQHPPGYPLHTLLGRLAVVLGPGPAAFNVNLLAAFLGAVSSVLGACLLFTLGLEWAPWASQRGRLGAFALCGGLLLAFLQTLWFQSTIAKGGIYTLNLALTLGTLLAVLRVRDAALSCPVETLRGGGPRSGLAPGSGTMAALLLGLGLANHWPSQVVLLPAYGLLLADAHLQRRAWPSVLAWPSLALKAAWPLVPGLTLYLYLPLRARLGPAQVWGDPATWAGFVRLIGRGQYTGVEASKTLGATWALAARVGEDLYQDWTWVGLGFVFLGWALLFRRRTLLACGLFAIPLGLVAGVLFKANPPPDSLFIIDPYLLPAQVGIGLGLAGFVALPRTRRLLAPGLLLGALALACLRPNLWKRPTDFWGWDYTHNLLLGVPRGAVLVGQGDSNIAGPMVPRLVYGRRGDITPIAAVLCDEGWYRAAVARQDPSLKWPPFALGPAQDFGWMASANASRPFAWTNSFDPTWTDAAHLLQRGLVFRLTATARPYPADLLASNDLWPAFVQRGMVGPGAGAAAMDPLTARLVWGNYMRSLADLALAFQNAGDFPAALARYRLMGVLNPGWAGPWLSAGALAWSQNDFAGAQGLWERAVDEQPDDAQAVADLGLAALKLGRSAQALRLARKSLWLDPSLRDGRTLLLLAAPPPRVGTQAPK